jgi:hypothetical protein
VTIEIAGGPALRLKPGDLASLPAALETVWHITPHSPSCGYSPDWSLAGYRTARSICGSGTDARRSAGNRPRIPCVIIWAWSRPGEGLGLGTLLP